MNFNPCYEHCYLKYGKNYIEECDECCDYAIAAKQVKYYEDLKKQNRLIIITSEEEQREVFRKKNCTICPYYTGEDCKKEICFIHDKVWR